MCTGRITDPSRWHLKPILAYFLTFSVNALHICVHLRLLSITQTPTSAALSTCLMKSKE